MTLTHRLVLNDKNWKAEELTDIQRASMYRMWLRDNANPQQTANIEQWLKEVWTPCFERGQSIAWKGGSMTWTGRNQMKARVWKRVQETMIPKFLKTVTVNHNGESVHYDENTHTQISDEDISRIRTEFLDHCCSSFIQQQKEQASGRGEGAAAGRRRRHVIASESDSDSATPPTIPAAKRLADAGNDRSPAHGEGAAGHARAQSKPLPALQVECFGCKGVESEIDELRKEKRRLETDVATALGTVSVLQDEVLELQRIVKRMKHESSGLDQCTMEFVEDCLGEGPSSSP